MRTAVERLRVPLAFWVAFVAIRFVVGGFGDVRLGPDDLTRLAQIDALLDGQGWWDLTMYRLGVDGVAMHWTRHVDALFLMLGGGVDALRPIALVVLPLLLALGLFVAVGLVADAVGGREAVFASLLLLLASVLTAVQFSPGRIDHHGLQIVLVLLAVVGLVRLERPGWAAGGGLALGLSLSIGMEQALVAAGIMLGVAMVVLGRGVPRASTDRFAGGLIAGTLVGALGFAPPSRLVQVACDVFSAQHVVVVVGAAVGLLVVSRVSRPAFGLLGPWALAGAAGIAVAPRCLDPYADVAPLLRAAWLPRVSEAGSLLDVLSSRPGSGLAVLVPAAVAVSYVLHRWARSSWSADGLGRLVPVLVLAFGGAFIQLRSASAATAIGAIALGVAFMDLRGRLLGWAVLPRVVVMALVAVVISGVGPLIVGASLDGDDGEGGVGLAAECASGLAAIGPGEVVAAPMDLGPRLLHGTDAQVLAGPYHRNGEGNLLAWEVLGAPLDAGRLTGVDWVVVCEGQPELTIIEAEFGPGLLGDLLDGNVPDALEPVGTDEGLLLYRIRG